MKNLTTIRVVQQVLERLKDFPIRERISDDEKAADPTESLIFTGALYGIKVDSLSDQALVLNVTGRPLPAKDQFDGKSQVIEILSDVFPCGLDPVGVVFMTENEDAEEDFDYIGQLIAQLPDSLLDVSDPIVLTCHGGQIRGYIHSEGSFVDAEVSTIDMTDVEKETTLVRVKGTLSVTCSLNETELGNVFKYLLEKLSSPYGSFRLENSDVHFLHTFRPKNKLGRGWVAQEMFQEAYEEDCIVTNLEPLGTEDENLASEKCVDDLWKLMKDESEVDDDDGFGVPATKTKKKQQKSKPLAKKETMNFHLYLKMSGDACTSKTLNCAPVIHYEKKDLKNVRIPIKIDSLGMVANSMKIIDLMEILKGCAQRQIQELARTVLSEFRMRSTVNLPEVFHLIPKPFGHFVSIVYTRALSCANFANFRRHLHKTFLLRCDQPYFRRMNRYVFLEDRPKKGPLMNVHVGLKNPGIGGIVAVVQGNYTYHHYLQDNFDDDGWGCAYRSLQTIISWFRFQGYTATEIPTHREIQKCLVDIGDKDSSFIGSKNWIGSTEVGFVLETSCKVQSRFMSVNSGVELATKGRELLEHFKIQGTPIMIGGGVLAHTILGVAWDEATDSIRYLVLDPHYTGSDWIDGKPNLPHIQTKGGIGWKGPEFWKKDAFYNLCMPQKPLQW